MKTLKIPSDITAKYPYASFSYGRGWMGHKTEKAAQQAAHRDSASMERRCGGGGGEPQWAVCRADGSVITGWQI